MAKTSTNRIAEVRKAHGLTQAQLAEKLGVHWVTVSKLERGRIQLHMGWMEAIASALKVDVLDLLPERSITKQITVNGSLSVGGKFSEFSGKEGMREPYQADIFENSTYDDLGMWVSVESDEYWPYFHSGDKLYFEDFPVKLSQNYIGRFVIALTESGPDLAGFLQSVMEQDRVDLQPINGKPVRGLHFETLWALQDIRFLMRAPNADNG